MITVAQVARYLQAYVTSYRREYERFTDASPVGGGYPRLMISPYLTTGRLDCYIANDGVVLLDESREPADLWYVAGGPALMPDYPETRTPPWVRQSIEDAGLTGEPIGIYRLVSKSGFSEEIWSGALGAPVSHVVASVDSLTISVSQYQLPWMELIRRLTFGALGLILDVGLPAESSEFWNPRIIRNVGFVTADRTARRFVSYGEFLRHTDEAAWDERSLWVRAHIDVRRDFAHSVSAIRNDSLFGGTLSFDAPHVPIDAAFDNHLQLLRDATDGLENLLNTQSGAREEVFHDYLRKNPILLDAYGVPESKPQLHYPPEEPGPTGKSFVVPDFIIRLDWNRSYKLVELERPDQNFATRAGNPRAEVTHGEYQIAEWMEYISLHYDLIRERFPHISGNYTTMLVISRNTAESFGGIANTQRQISIIRRRSGVDEIYTYDDLVARAREVIRKLTSLSDSLIGYPNTPQDS